jgi:molybdopterin converting factor small subunit
MCYGWEPDDIVQIITDLRENNEKNSLEIIGKALEKTALELGSKYRSEDYPNTNLFNFISRFYSNNDQNISLIKNESNEAIMETKKCKIFEIFKTLRQTDIGFQYKCRQDYFMIKGYDNSFILNIKKCLMKGDECCIHHYLKE